MTFEPVVTVKFIAPI